MSLKSLWGRRGSCVPRTTSGPERQAFVRYSDDELRSAFGAPATIPPILSLPEAAELVKLRPQTLKRKVCEGLYARSVVRGKPLRFWRDRLVGEVMQ